MPDDRKDIAEIALLRERNRWLSDHVELLTKQIVNLTQDLKYQTALGQELAKLVAQGETKEVGEDE